MRPRSRVKSSPETFIFFHNNLFKTKRILHPMRFLEKRRWLAVTLTILIGLEIFWFSSLSGKTTGAGISIMPIVYHFCVFFLLNFFLLNVAINKDKIENKIFFLVLSISTIYAILDELHQYFVPLRGSSFGDVVIDFFGITISALIYLYIKNKTTSSTENYFQ